MKPYSKSLFNQHNHLAKCIGDYLSSWQSSPLATLFTQIDKKLRNSAKPISSDSKSKKLLRQILRMILALVDRAGAVQNSKKIAKAFPRVIIGLGLLVWVAPYADTFYTRLDPNDKVSAEVWYYQSYNWLFLCLGPYLKGILNIIGIYFIFVQKSKIKTYVLAFPMMYDIGKIIWLLQVSNHDEYNSVPPDLFNLYGLATGVFLIGMLDLLSFWLFHRVHAVWARLNGLRKIANHADAQLIVNGFVRTMDDAEQVNQFQS